MPNSHSTTMTCINVGTGCFTEPSLSVVRTAISRFNVVAAVSTNRIWRSGSWLAQESDLIVPESRPQAEQAFSRLLLPDASAQTFSR